MIFFLALAYALESIKQIPPFLLSEGENYDLLLYDYFAGDYLLFNSNNSAIGISNSSFSLGSKLISNISSKSFAIESSLLTVLYDDYNTGYFLLPNTYSIQMFKYNGTNTNSSLEFIIPALHDSITSVTSFVSGRTYILIGTLKEEEGGYLINQFYIADFTEATNTRESTKLADPVTLWDIRYVQSENSSLLVCETEEALVPIIYYMYGKGIVYLYDFTAPKTPSLYGSFEFQGREILQCFYSIDYFYYISDNNFLYRYSPINLKLNSVGSMLIDITQGILSFSMTTSNEILITTQSSFVSLIPSIDEEGELHFDQFYNKNINVPYTLFNITGVIKLEEYIVFIGSNSLGSFLLLAKNSAGFPLLYNQQISETTIYFCAFQMSDNLIDVFVVNHTAMVMYQITVNSLAAAQISYGSIGVNLITAEEQYTGNSISLLLNVSQVISNISIYKIEETDIEVDMEFSGLMGTGILRLSDIFYGPAVECNGFTFDLNNQQYVSSITYNYTSYLSLLYSDQNLYGYTDFVIFMDTLIIYNMTYYLSLNLSDSSEIPEINKFKHRIDKIYAYKDSIYFYFNLYKDYFIGRSTSLNFEPIRYVRADEGLVDLLFSENYVALVYSEAVMVYYSHFDNFTVNITVAAHGACISLEDNIYLLTDTHIVQYYGNEFSTSTSIEGNFSKFSNITVNEHNISVFNAETVSVYVNSAQYYNKIISFPEPAHCIGTNGSLFAIVIDSIFYLYDISNDVIASLLESIGLDVETPCEISTCSIHFLNTSSTQYYIAVFCPPYFQALTYNTQGNYIQLNATLNSTAIIRSQVISLPSNLAVSSRLNQLDATQYSVTINLQVNGKLFYIDPLELSLMSNLKVYCHLPLTVNLDLIVKGQDVEFSSDSSSYHVTNKINNSNFFSCSFVDTLYVDLTANERYIVGISQKEIFICDVGSNSTVVYHPMGKRNLSFLSLQVIGMRDQGIRFLTGCTEYTETKYYWQASEYTINSTIHLLIIWEFNIETSKTVIIRAERISAKPDRLRMISWTEIGFTFVVFNIYALATPNKYFENEVILGAFDGVTLVNSTMQFSGFGISTIYVTDITGLYDPLFDTYYMYMADMNAGIRIFAVNKSNKNKQYLGLVSCPEPILGLGLSGRVIFASTSSTTIYYYLIVNYEQLHLFRVVSPLNSGFTPVNNTLVTSGPGYAMYLGQIITNGTAYQLQIIDNNAFNTTNIQLIDLNISQYSDATLKFYNSTCVFVQSNTKLLIYLLGNSQLMITNDYCISQNNSAQLTASNIYNTQNFSLNYSLEKDSNGANSLGSYNFSQTTIILLIVVPSFVIIVSVLLYLYFYRKRKRNIRSQPLFSYDFRHFESLIRE